MTNVTQRLALAVAAATPAMPSLRDRHISPHTIRHTTAMHLLQSGRTIDGIALWLGHESPTTTHQYTEANLAMKEKALAAAGPRHRQPALPRLGLAAGVPEEPVIMRSGTSAVGPPAYEVIQALAFHGLAHN